MENAMAKGSVVVVLFLFVAISFHGVRGMAIDEMIANASNSSLGFEFFDEGKQEVILEYDILMTYEEYNAMQQADKSDDTNRTKRAAPVKANRWNMRWPNNLVYYQYHDYWAFAKKEIFEINKAIQHWQQYTCLRFVQSTHAQSRIQFKNGGGCYSRIGMQRNPQTIGLGYGCRYKPIVLHEIGHALGLFHEQSRPDRDNYVTIFRQNVSPDKYGNFKKHSWEVMDDLGVPYDYESIMHYGKTAFAYNRRLTIRTHDPKFQDRIGRSRVLSFLDLKTVNKMYNCKRHIASCTKNDEECPNNGYVGKDCRCWCKGDSNDKENAEPVKRCSTTKPRPTSKPRPTRKPRPKPATRPTPRPATQRPNPRPRPATPRPRPATPRPRPATPRPQPMTPRPTPKPSECQDQHRSCSYWADKGECDAHPGYMHKYCTRSCDKCTAVVEECRDIHEACAKWKRMGYCTFRYPHITRPRCRLSCGLCSRS